MAVSYLQQKLATTQALHKNFASYLSVDGVVKAGADAVELMGGKDSTVTALLSLWKGARELGDAAKVNIIEPMQDMGKVINRVSSRIQGISGKIPGMGSSDHSGGNWSGKLETAIDYVDKAKPSKEDIMRKVETNVIVSLDTTYSGAVYEFTKEDFFKQQNSIALLARAMETRAQVNELAELWQEDLSKIEQNDLIAGSPSKSGNEECKEKECNTSLIGDISVNAQLYDMWDKLLTLQQLIMAQRLQLKAAQSLVQHNDTPVVLAADKLSGVEDAQTKPGEKPEEGQE